MSNNILNDIEDEIFDTVIKWTEDNPDELYDLSIYFSPQGYNRARAEKMASCFFSNPLNPVEQDSTFAGYAYAVIDDQESLFRIKIVNHDKRKVH